MDFLEKQLAHNEEAERKHQQLEEAMRMTALRQEKFTSIKPGDGWDIDTMKVCLENGHFHLDDDAIKDLVAIENKDRRLANLTKPDKELDDRFCDMYARAKINPEFLKDNKSEFLDGLIYMAKSHPGNAFDTIVENIGEVLADKEVKLENLENVMRVCDINIPEIGEPGSKSFKEEFLKEQIKDVIDSPTWQEAPKRGIRINENNFPDENFRAFLQSQSYGVDGVLRQDDIAKVTAIDCSNRGIKDLTGIERFTALRNLDCHGNELTTLTISNPELFKLACYDNQLTSLDISKAESLSMLDCQNNHLTELDRSKNAWLDHINAENNDFSKPEKAVETEKPYAAPDPNAKYEVFTVKQGMTSGLWDAEIQKKGECASFNYSDMYGKLATYEDLKRGVMLNYHVDLPSYDEIKAVPDMLRQNGPGEVTIIVPQDLETLYDNIFEHMEFSTGVENAIKDYRNGLKSHGIDTKALDAAIDKRDELGVLKEVQETYDQYAAAQDRMSVEKEYNYEHNIESKKCNIDR